MSSNQRKVSAARASFDRAAAALRAGDVAGAERLCRRALEQDPRDANFQSLLGAVLLRQRKADGAVVHLRRAAELMPGAAGAHEGLGQALLMQNNVDEALKSLETARRIEPGKISVLTTIGDVLTRLGRDDAALRIYRDLVTRRPSEVGALQRLGGAAFRTGLYPECEAVFMRVVALAPGLYEGWMDLGLVQRQQQKIERSIQSFAKAASIDPRRPEPHTALGSVLAASGRHAEAIAAFESALALDDSNADALVGLARAQKAAGQEPRAIASYRKCIAHHPQAGEAYWALANIETFRFEDDEIAAMLERLADNSLHPEHRTNMLFALAAANEARGDFDTAFGLFAEGNRLKRSRIRHDGDTASAATGELIKVFSRDFIDARSGHGDAGGSPIFIVGLPHSGATVIHQILANHSAVTATHDLPELTRIARETARGRADGATYPATIISLDDQQLHDLGSAYFERTLPLRSGAPMFTDLAPNNFRHVGLIALILSNAHIVHARRHPLDVCLASYKQLVAQGQTYSYDLAELGSYYLQYERLMTHWHEVLPGRVLDVQIETLVGDVEAEARRLIDHCGLQWEDTCLSPLHAAGVNRWRDYESHLGPLIEVLEPSLRALPPEWQPASMRAARTP